MAGELLHEPDPGEVVEDIEHRVAVGGHPLEMDHQNRLGSRRAKSRNLARCEA